jgi:DNA replication protein DnaC
MMNNLIDGLRRIGIRAPQNAIDTLLKHAQTSKLSHAQLLEHLCDIETRERDARNLLRRSRAATLGSFKTLDSFD